MNLKTRLTRIEQGIDVARLSDDQLQRLDMSRLSLAQIQSLDVTKLTVQQLETIGFENMTSGQVNALADLIDPETKAWIKSLSDEELRAAAEGRYERWEPGYKGESNA